MRTIELGDQSVTLVTHAERPDLEDQAQGEAFLSQWPRFMFHDPVADEHYPIMYERCPEFQFYLIDGAGSLLANGNSIPVAWDGTPEDLPGGWDEALLIGGPMVVIAALLVVAKRRVDRAAEQQSSESG